VSVSLVCFAWMMSDQFRDPRGSVISRGAKPSVLGRPMLFVVVR
jgi:hypothetical protein